MTATLTFTEMEILPPEIHKSITKANPLPTCSVDANVLSKKLEAAKRERDIADNRRLRRQATRDGTFLARGLSQTSISNPASPQAQKASAHTFPVKKAHNFRPRTQPAQCTADGLPVMDHKSMFAALNLGLAELEAMTSRLEHETTKQREFLCSRCRNQDTPSQHDHSNDTFRQQASKRASMPANPSRLVAVNHGSQTAYERVDIPDEDPPQYHAIPYGTNENVQPSYEQRLPLQPYDRPGWTQQSQCGAVDDTAFSVPSGYIFRRRNPQPAAAPEVEPARRSSIGYPQNQQEGHLISDAVKLIKQKERRAKRKSVVDFLRKL